MYRAGLLIVSQPLSKSQKHIPALLREISEFVEETLYVHIQPPSTIKNTTEWTVSKVPCSRELQNYIREFYSKNASLCFSLDIRILLGHISNSSFFNISKNHQLDKGYETVVFDVPKENNLEIVRNIQKYYLNSSSDVPITNLKPFLPENNTDTGDDSGPAPFKTYNFVALGGTFDRLHVGHKLLLNEGCLFCEKKLTVGVSEGEMNKKKVLVELLQSTWDRIENTRQFINDVKPQIEANVVPIYDVYGPTITDPNIEMIVLSEEVKKGGGIINQERKKRGMNELDEIVIDILDDPCHASSEDTKVSSSTLRRRLLGTLFHPVVKPSTPIPDVPYRIGLTGGTCSGKSTICKKLEKLGAGIVDCDKLGHEAYKKDTPAYKSIIEFFGADILAEDGEIDRKKLAPLVFSDKSKLDKLNQIVWPEIAKLAEKQIQDFDKEAKRIVVLDAAVLLEAGWNQMVHEVWTSIVPPDETVKRLMERNNLSEEAATKRVQSQMSNQERVDRSNVILCSLWEYEYTQSQVDKAWQHLQKRLPTPKL